MKEKRWSAFELTQAALHAPDLGATDRVIFALIADSVDASGRAYLAAQEKIAAKAQVSDRRVRDALALLEARGWIRRQRSNRQNGERGVDRITVTAGWGEAGRPAFKLQGELRLKPEPVVEPPQRQMPLAAVVAGRDQTRGPHASQPEDISGRTTANRKDFPLGQPEDISGPREQTSSKDISYKPSRGPGRSPHESGDPPRVETPEETAERKRAMVEGLRALADDLGTPKRRRA